MFEPNNSILIVDDVEKDLIDLSKVFNSAGVSCRTIQYDVEYNTPLKGVRIAFFDINLTNKTFDYNQEVFDYTQDENLSSVFNDLVVAIQNCIAIDSAPYALIFWSKNTNVKDNFIEYVRERAANLVSPLFIDVIDKSNFIGRPEETKIKIESIFENTSIKLLLDFENTCINATSNAIEEVFKIIPKNQKEEERIWSNAIGFEENFDSIFSKIAIGSLGYIHAKENPDKAIYEALIPLISNKILSTRFGTNWESNLSELKKSTKNNQPQFPKGFKASQLNSIFHIDFENKKRESRGCVTQICIDNKFESHFQISFVDWFSRLLPGLSKPMRNESITIAIEISSSCDYAQLKPRALKYLLGVLVKTNNFENLDETKKNNSLFVLDGEYLINNENYRICFNTNYAFTDYANDSVFQKELFTLKKEITDMIGNRYANHVSRIGITSF